MGIRVGWLPTGAEGAEDARAANGANMAQASVNHPLGGYVPAPAQAFALTSTGSLSCSVGAGQFWVLPGIAATQGAYPVTVDASGSGLPTVSFAAGGSLSRTDVIYLQVQDNAEDGSGHTQGNVAVQQGTNGGGVPSVPTGAVALWNVPVPASASSLNFATATFQPAATVALGGVYPAASSAQPAAAYRGQVRVRDDLVFTAAYGALEVNDGSAWQPVVPAVATQQSAWTSYSPVWGSTGTAPAIGNGSLIGYYAKVGRLVVAKLQLVAGSTTTFGSGAYTWTLPFTAAVTGFASGSRSQPGSYIEVAGGLFYCGSTFIGQATPTVFSCIVNGSGSTLSGTNPASMGSGSELDMTITYESTT